ncbi:cysteine--tRNA ligase [Leucobacter sp. M11]|uniref:cysteine--tRNA ligase n=1 Tax=Leucobacter sp. M11 TaxID=2993565 RepID=UPI002D7F927B|nr:cysteine--tRNA ligase [Leucobacter sp. M11]MEB4613958.1 cysteine--tRNA ligase [Leucobacter sp. M11]
MRQLIFDSQLGTTVDFQPLTPGRVGLYVCGPTVQSAPHIGHLRSALVYDQIRRWFSHEGLDVTLVRNVTDIDDKILEKAAEAQAAGGTEEWWALAYRVERDFTAAYDALGVLAPTYEPRATANIGPMIEIIETLIEREHAYVALDGSGSVYFDTASWPRYGELTHQQRGDMENAADSEPVGKRDPRDFALWKAHREHEPASASWPSPWGRGRPGWHIECSAMSTSYLGEAFDIHGGGLDLRFPHHENELAQSAAAGHGFAKHWIHNGLVNTAGQKMSKSLGNSVFAADLLGQARPIVLRYFLGSAHYRSVLDFSAGALDEAEIAFSRIEGFLDRALRELGAEAVVSGPVPEDFRRAMLNDFAIPQALAALHTRVRAGNSQLDGGDRAGAAETLGGVLTMLDVLGLNPNDPHWAGRESTGQPGAERALDALVGELLDERQTARANKDFAASDLIRDRLSAAGITIEDTPHGTHWSLHVE